jgi:hypothetical protein
MKIRIKGNSLRYRLSKSDVDKFCSNGYLEETTDFGSQKLIYALQREDAQELQATLDSNKITVTMPTIMATEWQQTDRVGFDGQHNKLSLLIEKDFQCLDNVAEDQSDNYPNPAGAC